MPHSLRGCEWFGSLDWGYNAPGCMLWWACLPDGHYHIGRELKFQGQSAETVAAEILRITRQDLRVSRLRYIACDPSMKAKTGHSRGESLMETLQRKRLPMKAGDNDRVNGWMRVHELLAIAPDGIPWLTVEPTCRYLIRTIAAQVSDDKNPDDLDTDGDDHAVDALRYGAMSRPSPTRFLTRPTRKTETAGDLLRGVREGIGQQVLGAGNVRRVA